jgi:hypothetical protein
VEEVMAFVKFTETGKSFSPKASINPRGYLSFNDGAKRRYKIDEADFVIIYYDAENKKIGIELGKGEPVEGALKLRKRETGATVGAKSFVDFFNIPITKTTIYSIIQGENPNWMILDLTKGKERNTKNDEEGGDDMEDVL